MGQRETIEAPHGRAEYGQGYAGHEHGCAGNGHGGDDYADGPTACIAAPQVMANIKQELKAQNILSLADARLARNSGLLALPAIERTGFNDGIIYAPKDVPQAMMLDGPARRSGARSGAKGSPTRRAALRTPGGAMHCLVLMVDFSDNPGTQTAAHFEHLLFDRANPDSMASFYADLSGGALSVTGHVSGWLRAQHPYGYYTDGASGTGNTFPKNTPGLLQEILTAYAKTHNLAVFNTNGDGYLDGLFLVHAGPGAEAVANPAERRDHIWSHKWTLPKRLTFQGVSAYAYFTAPEDGRLGVFAHEFGHFLGLPDLYDTSYRSHGIGRWCLMAAGSWNGQGNAPARLSAWCLSTLGWIKPSVVTMSATLTLQTLAKDPAACHRIWTGGAQGAEYFLIENRQKAGRDNGLPGSGLLLWHIDETQSDNSNPLAYRVALIQADGKRQLEMLANDGDAGDPFPGSRRVTAVDDLSAHPHMRANNGGPTGVALTNITMARRIVSVTVKV